MSKWETDGRPIQKKKHSNPAHQLLLSYGLESRNESHTGLHHTRTVFPSNPPRVLRCASGFSHPWSMSCRQGWLWNIRRVFLDLKTVSLSRPRSHYELHVQHNACLALSAVLAILDKSLQLKILYTASRTSLMTFTYLTTWALWRTTILKGKHTDPEDLLYSLQLSHAQTILVPFFRVSLFHDRGW